MTLFIQLVEEVLPVNMASKIIPKLKLGTGEESAMCPCALAKVVVISGYFKRNSVSSAQIVVVLSYGLTYLVIVDSMASAFAPLTTSTFSPPTK